GLQVAAVVDGAAPDRGGAGGAGRPGVLPGGGAGGPVPGGPAVDGDLDPGHHAAAGVGGGAGAGHRRPAGEAAGGGGGDGRGGGGRVGGRRLGDQPGLDGGRLRAHVGEQVDGGLAHVLVGDGGPEVGHAVVAEDVEAPGPLHGAGAEDQGAAGRPVRGQAVDGGAGAVVGA